MKKIFSLLPILLLAYASFAQPKEIKSYSLKEAVDYAINNNLTVKNAKLNEEKAKAFNWEILTQGLPQVNASLEYDYYFKRPQVPALNKFFSDTTSAFAKLAGHFAATDTFVRKLLYQSGGGFGSISFVLPNTVSSGLQVTQLLFDARYMFGVQARKDLFKTSRLSTGMTEQDIRYTVIKAYHQAEAALEAKSFLTENQKLVDKLLTDTRAVYAQGLIEELDVNRLELVKANLEGQINIQNQMADVALANLKFQMGLPLNDEIILTDKLDNLKSSANISAENTFDPKNRIEYELLNTAITLKGYDVKQKRSGYFPTLAGFLSYGWNAQAEKFTDIFKTQTQANPDGSTSKISSWYAQGLVGLSLKIPIFDSGMKWAQIKQAKLEQQKTRNDFENFKNAAELQFKAAKSGLTSALNDETNTQKTVELSKKIFSKNEIKFKQGAGSSFELVQSETDYITNQLKHIQSVMNLLNAKADLDKATGTK